MRTTYNKLTSKVNEFNAMGQRIKQLWDDYNNSVGLLRDQLRYELAYELHMQQYRLGKINELKAMEDPCND